MQKLYQILNEHLSGEKAHETVKKITQFYRSPGSQGYHVATNIIADMLKKNGFADLEVTRYPIDGEIKVNNRVFPLSWEPYDAKVRIINPIQEDIVNFDLAPSCLAWWSAPTPIGGIDAEVIDVGTGENESDYENKDLNGKVVYIHTTDRPEGWTYASSLALKKGAIGVLTDYFLYPMPPDRVQEDVPNSVQLLRLTENNHNKYQAWACSVNYEVGKTLDELLKIGPVTIHADIKCRSFKGEGQNLLATIEGTDLKQESVLFLSHTSTGTRPGANCAAGVGLSAEVAMTLKYLIDSNKIPRPRRSIKFLFVNEGLGSQVYIGSHMDELPYIKASFCFCSAGNHQDRTKSILVFCKNPDSVPSFLNDYYEWVMDNAPQDKYWVGREEYNMSSVVFDQVPYTPWSDNSAWAAYGVPSGLVMSWPDINFHSQLLTADTIDPKVIKRGGITSAIAAYEIANSDLKTAELIADIVFSKSLYRLQSIGNEIRHYILLSETSQDVDSVREMDHSLKVLEIITKRDVAAIQTTEGLIGAEIPQEFSQIISSYQSRLKEEAKRQISQVCSMQRNPIKRNQGEMV
jgi:aminopeptidase YwaD